MYRQIFTCQLGVLPMKYLGVPINMKRIYNKDWKRVEEKIEKKNLGAGKGSSLPMEGD